MNSLPLSKSMPRMGNGNWLMTYSMASKTQMAALFLTLRLMVQPVKTSVTVRVKQNSPLELPPRDPPGRFRRIRAYSRSIAPRCGSGPGT